MSGTTAGSKTQADPAQLPLEWPPRTHAGDPGSSHRAEARLRTSGRLTRQQRVVLEWVVVAPGLTASQVAERIAGAPDSDLFAAGEHERLCQVRRRLSDLRVAGHVRRRYTPGDRESRWFPALP